MVISRVRVRFRIASVQLWLGYTIPGISYIGEPGPPDSKLNQWPSAQERHPLEDGSREWELGMEVGLGFDTFLRVHSFKSLTIPHVISQKYLHPEAVMPFPCCLLCGWRV